MRPRLLLLTATLVAFGASLVSGFHFDDYAIFADPSLASASGWMEMFSLRQTRPLTYLTLWLNYAIEGAGSAIGYHVVNLGLHLA
ncbi:MAG: repeat-containing protein, partial [Thermomicrobiales bacterium]|nr:repeat-containing protein [Thermomicrobiales bacterium]